MFPVQRLYPNITLDFKKYSSIFISEAIANGLRNEITIVDQESSTSTFAKIVAHKKTKTIIMTMRLFSLQHLVSIFGLYVMSF